MDKKKSVKASTVIYTLADICEIPKIKVKKLFEELEKLIVENAPDAGVIVPAIGKVYVHYKKERQITDKTTGELRTIKAKRILKVKVPMATRKIILAKAEEIAIPPPAPSA